MFGIGPFPESNWSFRVDLIIGSMALVMSELYKVACENAKNAPKQTLMEDKPLSDILTKSLSQIGAKNSLRPSS